jgi:hypothetical protein
MSTKKRRATMRIEEKFFFDEINKLSPDCNGKVCKGKVETDSEETVYSKCPGYGSAHICSR